MITQTNTKHKALSAVLPEKLKIAVEKKAQELNVTQSNVIKIALSKYLTEGGQNKS